MSDEKLLGGLLTRIEVMLNGLAANATDLAHLEGRRANLQAVHDALVSLNQEQEAAKALVQQLTEQLGDKTDEAKTELRLLRKGVEAVYGDDGQKLEEFGIQVRS